MNTTELKCPACRETNNESLITFDRTPLSCAQLFSTKEAAVAGGQCSVDILQCQTCGHLWNASHEPGSSSFYDDDYYSSFTSSQTARDYQKEIARDLDSIIGLKSKTVVEIGSGDGFFLKSLANLGANAIGFEPSSTYAVAAQHPGINVLNDMFRMDGDDRVGEVVDLVAMRHVLEHMQSPAEVLSALTGAAFNGRKPKYLFIEVPNSIRLLEDNLYFDFYNDHVQYFCDHSLVQLFQSCGWNPVASIAGNEEFLRMLCINADFGSGANAKAENGLVQSSPAKAKSAAADFRSSFTDWRADLNDLLAAQSEKGKSIAVWGAGARGISLLCGLGLEPSSISCVVDSDPNKHGRYLPVLHLPVSPLEQLKEQPVDCVLVTSYTYFDEIVGQLEWFKESGGTIIKIYPAPELVA